jgi:hypothetical protein
MKLLDLIIANRKIRDANVWQKEDPLIYVSPNVGPAVFVIAGGRQLVGMPDQVYIQCGHNEHMLRRRDQIEKSGSSG